jgi:MFS family permease
MRRGGATRVRVDWRVQAVHPSTAVQAPVSATTGEPHPSSTSLRGLDMLNFWLADVQTGVGPFLAIYLATQKWDEQRVGLALTVGGIAGIVAQTPAGWIVDRARAKRALIAGGVTALAASALVLALAPHFIPVLGAQVLIGASSSVFMPAICAISLGVVGKRMFDARQGRNQTYNSAGNVVAAAVMGAVGYYVSDRGVFLFVVALAVPTLQTLHLIKPDEIDFERARGARAAKSERQAEPKVRLLRDRTLVMFLASAVLFHFSNAAMLPLLGELLAKGHDRSSMMFMSSCVITTQIVVALTASWWGRYAGTWGRRPLLLIAFAALPIRGVLYTLTDNTILLVAIQILDGIGAGLFGVVSVLVIADRTGGTGRFNFALGAISTATGIGASLSQVVAGSIAHHFGSHAGFLFLASVGVAALVLLFVGVQETRTVGETELPGGHVACNRVTHA